MHVPCCRPVDQSCRFVSTSVVLVGVCAEKLCSPDALSERATAPHTHAQNTHPNARLHCHSETAVPTQGALCSVPISWIVSGCKNENNTLSPYEAIYYNCQTCWRQHVWRAVIFFLLEKVNSVQKFLGFYTNPKLKTYVADFFHCYKTDLSVCWH